MHFTSPKYMVITLTAVVLVIIGAAALWRSTTPLNHLPPAVSPGIDSPTAQPSVTSSSSPKPSPSNQVIDDDLHVLQDLPITSNCQLKVTATGGSLTPQECSLQIVTPGGNCAPEDCPPDAQLNSYRFIITGSPDSSLHETTTSKVSVYSTSSTSPLK